MIKSIQIQNFASHKKTKLEFSPGVNIIVGPTDSGKSAIIKALQWVILNRPVGDSFRSNWGGITKVVLRLDNNKIIRTKSDKGNKYQLNDLVFKAFKSKVPEEILQALNITEVNLSTQFSPHFLLSKSPGDVATYLNEIAHLDKIDTGLKNLNKEYFRTNAAIKHDQSLIQDMKDQIESLPDIDKLEELVTDFEKVESNILRINDDLYSLNSYVRRISKIEGRIISISQVESLDSTVRNLVTCVDTLETKEKLLQSLKNRWNYIQLLEEDVIRESVIESAVLIINEIVKIDKLLSNNSLNLLTNYSTKIASINAKIKNRSKDLKELESTWHNEIAGSLCPVCGSKIKSK